MRLAVSALQCLSALWAVSTVGRGGPSALRPTACRAGGPCAAPHSRREPPPSAAQSTAAFAPCHEADLPTACAGDGGCPHKRTARGGLPRWRPTACTEYRHRNKEETNKLQEGEAVKRRTSCWSQGRGEAGGCHPGVGCGAWAGPQHPGLYNPPALAAGPGSRNGPRHTRG